MKPILLGADPELFYKEAGQLVSAYGLIEGTKEAPYVVANGAVQVDGMALEFNIDPADNEDQWCANLQSVLAQLNEMVPGELEIVSTADFGYDYISSQPEEARKLGCDPDMDAYTERENPAPDAETPFRTAAGHIHLGLVDNWEVGKPEVIQMCAKLARELDASIGLASVLMDPDVQRRQLYGKAGAFRVKPYGMEYRVLSNFWLKDERLMRWVFNSTQGVVDRFRSCLSQNDEGRLLQNYLFGIPSTINNSKINDAIWLTRTYDYLFKEIPGFWEEVKKHV